MDTVLGLDARGWRKPMTPEPREQGKDYWMEVGSDVSIASNETKMKREDRVH